MLPGVKSTSYAVNMAAEAEARRRGADDAVFVDTSGIVLEGPTTNIWWRRERTLFTPSLDLGILAGVTRATVIELAGEARVRRRGGHVPPARAPGSRRGLHLLVRARGDARHGARRQSRSAAAPPPMSCRPRSDGLLGLRWRHEQDSPRWDGALERRARARPDRVGLRDPHDVGRDQGRLGAQAPARAARIQQPFLRGPLRLAESFAMIPELRRKLPEARLPFERPAVLAATLASARDRSGRAPVGPGSAPSLESSPRGRAVARARRSSRFAAASSPRTTAPSTSRSGRTSTARSARRSTSAAAHT